MKFYCKKCGSEVTVGDKVPPEDMPFESYSMECPFGWEHGEMQSVPDYETLEQWEKRTGKFFPDDGIVFVLENDSDAPYWNVYRYDEFYEAAGRAIVNEIIVVAGPPVPPPDNWRPE